MEKTPARRWAKILKTMITIVMVFNLVALYFVPMLELCTPEEIVVWLRGSILCLLDSRSNSDWDLYVPATFMALMAWGEFLDELPWAVYTILRLTCGCCTYVILRQARHILDTVLSGNPFQTANANSLKRAANCCWIVAGAAVLKLIADLLWREGPAAWVSYNTLFIPAFLVGGLLFWLMSALFCQAAELKEDQDLTI